MKAVIVCDGKYGSTYNVALSIRRELLKNSVIINLQQERVEDLDQYDCVIIGSAIYGGTIKKSIHHFLKMNEDILKTKKVFLYTNSSSNYELALQQLKEAYGEHLLNYVSGIEVFKGDVDFYKINWLEKIIILRKAKKNPDVLDQAIIRNLMALQSLIKQIKEKVS